jgi:hypothetical protein
METAGRNVAKGIVTLAGEGHGTTGISAKGKKTLVVTLEPWRPQFGKQFPNHLIDLDPAWGC